MGGKDGDKGRFSDLVTFIGLSRRTGIPRQTLINWREILKFPTVVPDGKVQKMYPFKECSDILKVFRKKQDKGFKRSVAAEKTLKSKKYRKIMKRFWKKYDGCEIIL